MKLISFIIPIYNEEERLSICLDSILKQKTDQIEVLLVDDCSTDNTIEIMREYEHNFDCVRIFRLLENKGQSVARNLGIDNAEGEFIWFVDADDYISDNSIEELCEVITNNKKLDCIYFMWEKVMGSYKHEAPHVIELADISEEKIYSGKELFGLLIERLPRIPDSVCRCLISKKFIDDNGLRFMEGVIFEDGIFGTNIYLLAKRVIHLRSPYYVYYNNLSSTGHVVDEVFNFACSFIEFSHFLSMGYKYALEEDIKKSYTQHLRNAYLNMCRLRDKVNREVDLIEYINKLDRDAANLYRVLFDKEIDLNRKMHDELMGHLSSYKSVIIYGAGKKAKEIANVIDGLERSILAYVVSDEYTKDKYPLNPRYIYGVPVISISEISKYPQTIPVIITVRKVHQDAVIKSLLDKGYDNIICLS